MLQNIDIGDRVRVFDATLYLDDIQTPLSVTMQNATVIDKYNKKSLVIDCTYYYKNLLTVIFDHDGRVSKGHFMEMVTKI